MAVRKDYTGQICGCWKVIERDLKPKSKSHETFWKAECQVCGNLASVRKTDLDKAPASCNNCKGISFRSWKVGDRYGLLTIIDKGKPHGNKARVKVQCDCGSEPFDVRICDLKGQSHGRTISCGCTSESSGELKIRKLLEEYDIDFQAQYRIKDVDNKVMIFDFVIFREDKIIAAIEFNGKQHYEPIEFFGGEEAFKKQKKRDERKAAFCYRHAINLQWIPYWDYDSINPEYLNLKDYC